MALLCVVIRSDSVSLLRFPFHGHVHEILLEKTWTLSRSSRVRFRQFSFLESYFPSHFCFPIIVVLLIFMLSMLFLVTVFALFYEVFESYWCMYALFSADVSFLLIFLTHIICLCHLSDVMPYASLLTFLSSSPFVVVLHSIISRMALSILKGR